MGCSGLIGEGKGLQRGEAEEARSKCTHLHTMLLSSIPGQFLYFGLIGSHKYPSRFCRKVIAKT